jgi:hypothetical protein
MGDFGRVGAASLWKSGPLFSTASKEAELMLDELRLNPEASVARLGPRSRDAMSGGGGADIAPSLSTGFAEQSEPRSTGVGAKEKAG